MKTHLYFSFPFMLLFFFSCSGEKKESIREEKDTSIAVIHHPLVVPPSPSLNPAYEKHSISADSGANIYIKNSLGSSISVPAGVLVDSLRHPVSGRVQVSYREMHDAAGTFLAGVPHDYDAAGMQKRFETAGMFEIRAEQDNKNVFVDSGKTITVSFGGKTPGDDFHFFYLDELVTRNWHYVGDAGGIATGKKKLNTNILALKIPFGPDYFVLNYEAALDVMYNDNLAQIKANKANPEVGKKVKAYGLKWSNIYNYETIEFRGKKYLSTLIVWKSLTGTDFPDWLSQATSKITHKSGNTYQVNLQDKKGHEDFFIIEAVMPLKDLLARPAEEWKKSYQDAVKKLKEEEESQQNMADVYRTFEINKFGFYSYDKYMNDDNSMIVKADFSFDREVEKEKIDIYYVNETNRTLIKFPRKSWAHFILWPGMKGKLFAMLPDNNIAVYTSKQLAELNYDFLKNLSRPDMTFDMVTVKKIEKEEDLREILLSN